MSSSWSHRIVGLTPLHRPDVRLAIALARAGALAILDLGREEATARRALGELERGRPGPCGVRLGGGVKAAELPKCVEWLLVPAPALPIDAAGRRVLAEVVSIEEARAAIAAGAAALVVKGHEAGGRVGEEGLFVLLQRVAREAKLPLVAQGGIGLHGAAAALAGGASAVLLDVQLALLAEATVPAATKTALQAMDGSETALCCGHRLFARAGTVLPPRGATAAELHERLSDDVTKGLAPIGQDGAFARPLAERFRTVGGLVRGLPELADAHLRSAAALTPLAEGAPLAKLHGTRWPIVQGPMTRVSDRAEFAAAVADGGALPLVACSLLRGAELGALLEETAAALAGRPWGVGLLGFAPAELLEEQLAIVRRLRPPVAILAGGRPAQAKALEELGVATFLHVPSPGLLELFLKEGARRFVLEGRECGGHVGPRSALVLWESALEKLLAEGAPTDVQVLFAGGLHDAVSGAMVAAMAAPLAARGGRLGVVLGTGYLFTKEAVSTGAILPAFQREAIACERTALLETAPGHATRCARTPIVAAFEAERARLEAAGTAPDALWAELERFNLGRLRIAAKGLAREGAALVTVDEAAQATQGLYMLGQLAALRSEVTTIAKLHAELCAGSSQRLQARAPVRTGPRALGADVAIVGMACILPGAPDLQRYWRNVVTGFDAVTEVPATRWSAPLFHDPAGAPGETTPSKWGGFVPETVFEPGAWGIPPKSLSSIEPVQLLALEVARRALADAGYEGEGARPLDRERTSVIFGAEAGTDLATAYGLRSAYRQLHGELPAEVSEALPTLTEDSFPGVLANVIAGRIANRLDLGGVNYTVDAACASSLAAVDLAVKELTSGTSDTVLCGGADLHNSLQDFLMFSAVHALSPTGHCRTFDAKADGIALGEGVACLVLRRRVDAERDGDRIYAVIRGVGGASDGRSLGLTAPRKEGQVRALERAYRAAGMAPAEVELVEAHGTGTVVGDRTELATLTEVWTGAGARPGSCALGSVKSQIGHTKCAAGLAGLVKAALAAYHGVLPPTSQLESPNPAWDPRSSPFVLHREARPWTSARRIAGVSAFGFGGTNFHVVLEQEGPPAPSGLPAWPAELYLVRGRTDEEARALLARVQQRVEGEPALPLPALAAAVARSGKGPVRIAIVARTREELLERLADAKLSRANRDGLFLSGATPAGPIALLFPGQGSQRPGMLAELFVAFPALRAHLHGTGTLAALLHPPLAFTPEEQKAQRAALTDTRAAQPALGVVDLAAAELLESLGVRPAMVGGHSYGELPALAFAGALPKEALFSLSCARARCILDAAAGAPGTMAAVRGSAERVAPLVAPFPGVVLANLNAPDQVVIAGPDAGVDAACEALALAGLAARRIPVACAFHSGVVKGAAETFAFELATVAVAPPRLPAFANVTARPHEAAADAIRASLAAQVASPVRFAEQIEAMWEAGARIFVEAGPGEVLTDLVTRILGSRPHLAIAIDRGDGGVRSLLLALARLATAGVPVDGEALFAGRGLPAHDLDTLPSCAPSASAWIVDGHRARPLHGEVPAHGLRPRTQPLPLAKGGAEAPLVPGDAREEAVHAYLRGMRELVEGQRQVMLRFLGEEPGARAIPIESRPSRAEAKAELVVAAPARPRLSPAEELTAIVAERTGYPPEMLDPDLDLEADLGIDSIKRIEILGTLAERLGLGAGGGGGNARSELIEPLAAVKTLRAIATFLQTRGLGGAQPSGAALAVVEVEGGTATGPRVPEQLQRFTFTATPLPEPAGPRRTLQGRRFTLLDDGRVAPLLAERLRDAGAVPTLAGGRPAPLETDELVDLRALGGEAPPEPAEALFPWLKLALEGGATGVAAATALGGRFGLDGHAGAGGTGGLLRALHKERPELRVQRIDLQATAPAGTLAERLFQELSEARGPIDVGWASGARLGRTAIASPLAPDATSAKLPEGAVVLVTGGARGITARVAIELSRRQRCTLVLVGRSPLPEGEEPAALAAAKDAPALRRALLEAGGPREPAAIEAAVAKLLAAREVRGTLDALRANGAAVEYRALDARDEAALSALIDDLYARHGRIDGVLHGAGVLEDKLLGEKTEASFRRVYGTKLVPARLFAKKLRPDVSFVGFFGSISGAFGNRGQLDYAAANDALDQLAHALRGKLCGRVVSLDWGPWGGGGMVSAELAREYARRGLGLVAPDDGVSALFAELERGGDAQVVLVQAQLEALA